MNSLLIGLADKTDQLLQAAQPPFLLIDDGPIAALFAKQFRDATIFNPRKHSFFPSRDYKSVRDFASTVYGSGHGENTLTVRNGKRALAKLLLDNPLPFHKLTGDRKDPAIAEALGTIDDLLLSPVLKRVLTRKPNFDFEGSVIARINRAELGDFDAFVLGTLLIGQFKGQVLVPDFGFYGRDFHQTLIRQNRVVLGVNYLAELPAKLQQAVLTIKDKQINRVSREDAERLIFYVNPLGNPSTLME